MSNHAGLQSIINLEFYKKQKDWKFKRQKPTFDFDRDTEKAINRRQLGKKQSYFISSHSYSSETENRCNSNSSRSSDSNRNSVTDTVSKLSKEKYVNNTAIPKNKSNQTYDLQKYKYDFDNYNDKTSISDDNIDGEMDTKLDNTYSMEPIELNTIFDGELPENITDLVYYPDYILSGSMQASEEVPEMNDLGSEEQFFIGASKEFHSSEIDLSSWNPEKPMSAFKDYDEQALTPVTKASYPGTDDAELKRMEKMSYNELVHEVVVEHVQMQQHLHRRNHLMETMGNEILSHTVEDVTLGNQNFGYDVHRQESHIHYRFVTRPGGSNERFSRYTKIPLFWNE